MKAILLAGGEGTRLRPVSCHRPKPMVRLFDKPVLEHSVDLLRKHGFNDIMMTLKFMPQVIQDYFGDGHDFGATIRYNIEETPLGTAGGVADALRASGENIGEELLILSGDAVTDFDLTAALAFHREKKAAATLLLKRQVQLLDYGLVMLKGNGAIDRFIEKPSWQQVFSDLVNTGVYIIDPSILDEIPVGGTCDFAKNLFPSLLKRGAPIYGVEMDGYWCDIGDPEAYLRCHHDALDDKISLFASAIQSEIGEDVNIIAPCYIGEHVTIAQNCTIGPYTILGAETSIGNDAVVERSLIDGARIDDNADTMGAIVCRGATIKQGAQLAEFSVVGEGSVIGEHTVLHEHCRIWPNKEIDANEQICGSIMSGQVRTTLQFDGHGQIAGELGVDFTPEFCLRLGAAIAGAANGKIGIGYSGGQSARIYAELLAGACNSAGVDVMKHDAPSAAAAAFAASEYSLDMSIFVRQQKHRLTVSLFDNYGISIDRDMERKLESNTKRGDFIVASSDKTGVSESIDGVPAAYLRACTSHIESGNPVLQHVRKQGMDVMVSGKNLLASALAASGCRLLPPSQSGAPYLSMDTEGFALFCADERGKAYQSDRLLALVCFMAWEDGIPAIAVPAEAPNCLDMWAEAKGKQLLRIGRNEAARELLARQHFIRDAVGQACYLMDGLNARTMPLWEYNTKVP